MAKIVVKIKGGIDEGSAAIDGFKLFLVGAGSTLRAEVTEVAGTHLLQWQVVGPPGAEFTISLSGATEDWSEEFNVREKGPYKGRHIGSTKFEVK